MTAQARLSPVRGPLAARSVGISYCGVLILGLCLALDVYAELRDSSGGPSWETHPIGGRSVYVLSAGVGIPAGTDEMLVYDNPLGQIAVELPADLWIADDLTLTVESDCPLRRYRFQVSGKVDPQACGGPGVSCGPLTIEYQLFSACPSAGGLPILGTEGCVSNEPDRTDCLPLQSEFDVTEVNIEVAAEDGVRLPSTVWLAVRTNRPGAGVIFGAPALQGFTDDVVDVLGFPCRASLGGFPRFPFSGFNASVYVDANCEDTFPVYRNIRSAQSGINAGADNCVADDLTVIDECLLTEMEIGVRNTGLYDIELRRSIGNRPEGNCMGGVDSMGQFEIPGTHRRFVVSSAGLSIQRFEFDPPVPLPANQVFAVIVPSNVNAQWVLTGKNSSIGTTGEEYYVGNNKGFDPVVPSNGAHGGLQVVLSCAGSAPVGACCDQYNRDEDNEAVCRDVPFVNCPFPPRGSMAEPRWEKGASCRSCDAGPRRGLSCQRDEDCPDGLCTTNEPFDHPCGVSACCTPRSTCENLTLNECNSLEPTDGARFWELGQFCDDLSQRCPLVACIDGEGDCRLPHGGLGCRSPFCCDAVCRFDAWCCDVAWDELCERWANGVFEDCDEPASNDSCAPSADGRHPGAREIVVGGEAITAWVNRASSTPEEPGFCCHSGNRRCEGGCNEGAICRSDEECRGTPDGYCNFPPDFSSPGTCTDGCNSQELCLSANDPPETTCIGGPNGGLPCKPRCVGGTRAGLPCGNVGDCPEGTACDGTADCGDGNICDNAFCEGADDGVCADALPEPGTVGFGSVWFKFTVPQTGSGAMADIEVSTCGSELPASDSLLQVFTGTEHDEGVCGGLGQCDDGSSCLIEGRACADLSECAAVEQACSISRQDCPLGASCGKIPVHPCNRLALIGCNDDAADGCGNGAEVGNSKLCLTDLTRGQTYYVQLAAKRPDTQAPYTITVREVDTCTGDQVPPANDVCERAQPITDVELEFDLDNATHDCFQGTCLAEMGNDVWYTYRPDQAGVAIVETCGDPASNPLNTALIVYDGCGCGSNLARPLCCSRSRGPGSCDVDASQCTVDVRQNLCYLIQLGDHLGDGASGKLSIALSPSAECPAGPVTWVDPAPGTVDARVPLDPAEPSTLAGIDRVLLQGSVGAATACWSLCESNTNPALHPDYPANLQANSVQSVTDNGDGTMTIELARPITPGELTVLTYTSDSGQVSNLELIALPGDVSGSEATTASDVLDLVDILNGLASPVWGIRSTDCDRTGEINATDILCVIDLLNAGWNLVAIDRQDLVCP